jgi:arylsulfatase A-like enzyme
MAGYKASARSLDHGVGAVLNALMTAGLTERTLVVFTTDHGLAFPGAKATLSDRGIGVTLIVRGPGGFTGGRVINALTSHVDVYPTLCELAGVPTPGFAQGRSLMPLVRGEADEVRDAIFAELTYHVAYEPQRAIRTRRFKYVRRFEGAGPPVLANVDDSPSKRALRELGWFDRTLPAEQLYDLVTDPGEMRDLAGDRSLAGVLEDLRRRLEDWMRDTGDPLVDGPVPAPRGARVNRPTDVSPDDPPVVVGARAEALVR